MNDVESRQAVQSIVRKKFRGRKEIKSKVHTHYKENLNREYQRLIEAYFALLIPIITKHLEILFARPEGNQTVKNVYREDDRKSDFLNYIRSAFKDMKNDFHKKEQPFGLAKKIQKVADLSEKLSISEWKRTVQKTLGIDILDDYYSGEFYRTQLQQWAEQNVGLISTLPDDVLDEMQNIVEDGYTRGKTTRDMVKEIQDRFNVSKKKAKFWATDQLAKLNAEITQQQQTDCGVEEYVWSTSGDQRVRDKHRELNGKRFRWDNPPIVDDRTGRRAHPGQDYRCRCVALPVFNLETLNLPIKVKINKEDTL